MIEAMDLVEEIHVKTTDLDDKHEVIGEKFNYRLAQRPGASAVLKYNRPVIKKKVDGTVSCLSALATTTEPAHRRFSASMLDSISSAEHSGGAGRRDRD